MAQYNPNDYETVEERLRRFWADEANADARIITVNRTTEQDRQASTWVVEARVYLNRDDHAADLPKATGWAFEVDGGKGANQTSALENCETSAIGRCLANMNYSGNKRVTREEMAKVQRGVTPQAPKPVDNSAKPSARVKLSGEMTPWVPIDELTANERKTICSSIAKATDKDTLKTIWDTHSTHLNESWINSVGELVTLKQLITTRVGEVSNA